MTNIISIKNNFGYKLISSFNFVFLIILILCTLYIGLAPSQNKFGLFVSPLPIVAESGALIAILIYFMNKKMPQFMVKYAHVLIAVFFIIIFILQLIIARSLQSYGYTWDSQQMFNQAVKYAIHGRIDISYTSYIQNYSNNIALLSGLGALFRFLHGFGINDFLTAAVFVNVCCMWITQLITFLLIKMLVGIRTAVLSLVFCFVFISLSMYVSIPYTDTLTIVFPVLILYIAFHIARTNHTLLKIFFTILLGIVTIFGTLLKPTVIIASIAVGIVAILWFLFTKKQDNLRKVLTVTTCCIFTFFLVIVSTYFAYIKAVDTMKIVPYPVEKAQMTSIPPVFFIAMGLKTDIYANSKNYGGYDGSLSSKVISLSTEQEKTKFSLQTIKTELHEYGFWGYTNFVIHKANWVLSDGTFFSWGEGSNTHVVFSNNDKLSTFIRNFMYVTGSQYIMFGNILQVFWLAILILICAQLFILILDKDSRTESYSLTLRLMIAGIIIFLLLFEGRSRYIFLYVPIFIALAANTLKWFESNQYQK